MEDHSETGIPRQRSIWTWLFNPFHYVAGGKALAVGIVVIVAAGLIGSLSKSHFDGVLDFHTGAPAPLWIFVCEGLIGWLVLGVLLLIGGKIISKSRVRAMDVLGTQALARFPTVVTAAFAMLPGYQRFGPELLKLLGKAPELQFHLPDVVSFGVVILVGLLMAVWMVALMYRAFSVSCNVRGGKAVGVFIAVLILAEAASIALLWAAMRAV